MFKERDTDNRNDKEGDVPLKGTDSSQKEKDGNGSAAPGKIATPEAGLVESQHSTPSPVTASSAPGSWLHIPIPERRDMRLTQVYGKRPSPPLRQAAEQFPKWEGLATIAGRLLQERTLHKCRKEK